MTTYRVLETDGEHEFIVDDYLTRREAFELRDRDWRHRCVQQLVPSLGEWEVVD